MSPVIWESLARGGVSKMFSCADLRKCRVKCLWFNKNYKTRHDEKSSLRSEIESQVEKVMKIHDLPPVSYVIYIGNLCDRKVGAPIPRPSFSRITFFWSNIFSIGQKFYHGNQFVRLLRDSEVDRSKTRFLRAKETRGGHLIFEHSLV